jgi:hypothetical protein
MLKGVDMTKYMPIQAITSADPEEAVDAAVVKIEKEKRCVSVGFADMGGVHGRISNDGDQEERAEV